MNRPAGLEDWLIKIGIHDLDNQSQWLLYIQMKEPGIAEKAANNTVIYLSNNTGSFTSRRVLNSRV